MDHLENFDVLKRFLRQGNKKTFFLSPPGFTYCFKKIYTTFQMGKRGQKLAISSAAPNRHANMEMVLPQDLAYNAFFPKVSQFVKM